MFSMQENHYIATSLSISTLYFYYHHRHRHRHFHINMTRGKANTLGGKNGRLVCEKKRLQIVELYEQGHGTRAIARLVRVNFSCVAKWLRRYKQTGTVQPGTPGRRWPRVESSQVAAEEEKGQEVALPVCKIFLHVIDTHRSNKRLS